MSLSGWALSARARLVRVASRILCGFSPEPKRLRWGTVHKGSYWPTHRDAGFFSICSTTLGDLGSLEGSVSRIFANKVLRQYRALPRMNSWSLFFRQPSRTTDDVTPSPYVSTLVKQNLHHGEYFALDFASFAPFVDRYFTPSKSVERRKRRFLRTYRINPRDLIAVNIRGTDKWKEIPSASVDRYVQLAERALSNSPNSRILLVTDQHQFLAPFEARFQDRLIVIRELPTTSLSDRPVHHALRIGARKDFGVNFLAAVLIVASARVVITHTGNTAFWTALFRGNTNGLVQLRGAETFGDLAS